MESNEMTQAEIEKIRAEIGKLMAETAKLNKETFWYPVLISSGLIGAVAGVTTALIKLF